MIGLGGKNERIGTFLKEMERQVVSSLQVDSFAKSSKQSGGVNCLVCIGDVVRILHTEALKGLKIMNYNMRIGDGMEGVDLHEDFRAVFSSACTKALDKKSGRINSALFC